ncbi:protein NRT1/ PTR FAMILY 2.7 [Sesamum alatum]|uniref:Protein NRT1/ PTR FAMILY 2.7 n=1 Tax=Sesamum alatum TaxID=300844 RepID=A0AAE2D0B0_9LAMI|nr:protein NRT1/ PTR FAMILY 2.7 [Sesamum alatum]
MAALHAGGNTSLSGDGEAPPPPTVDRRRGGWITAPFILASIAGMTLAAGGWMSNLIVFLIQEFNIKSINAAQIFNVASGCANFFPVLAAILADSFLGCFSVIWISSLISFMGLILLVLTVTIDGLRPSDCETGSSVCATPSRIQYAVLFAALALVSIGLGGTRFTLATIGANQFNKHKHQATYFNLYFFTLYVNSFICSTGIVYVQDNLSWAWGYGISIAGSAVGLAVFLVGRRFYYRDKPRGSPFMSMARVVVACVRKRKAEVSYESADYYYGDVDGVKGAAPTKSFRILNRAALKTEGDILPNGSISKPWKLCTVQQVEDLKSLIRILPLWSTSILLSTPIAIQVSLTVLQALATDRHLGRRFQIPAGSMAVFSLISIAISLSLFDHVLWPMWKKVAGKNPTPLQQIGIGHLFNIASMAVSAIVESKRRTAATSHHHPMSVLWLVPQLVMVGMGEAFHFPGQVALYYQEFPSCLKSMASAMVAMVVGVAFYLSSAVVGFVKRVTEWLPDDIDDGGRVDNVYWVVVVIGVFNFGYYVVCSWLYKYKNVGVEEAGDHRSDSES